VKTAVDKATRKSLFLHTLCILDKETNPNLLSSTPQGFGGKCHQTFSETPFSFEGLFS